MFSCSEFFFKNARDSILIETNKSCHIQIQMSLEIKYVILN